MLQLCHRLSHTDMPVAAKGIKEGYRDRRPRPAPAVSESCKASASGCGCETRACWKRFLPILLARARRLRRDVSAPLRQSIGPSLIRCRSNGPERPGLPGPGCPFATAGHCCQPARRRWQRAEGPSKGLARDEQRAQVSAVPEGQQHGPPPPARASHHHRRPAAAFTGTGAALRRPPPPGAAAVIVHRRQAVAGGGGALLDDDLISARLPPSICQRREKPAPQPPAVGQRPARPCVVQRRRRRRQARRGHSPPSHARSGAVHWGDPSRAGTAPQPELGRRRGCGGGSSGRSGVRGCCCCARVVGAPCTIRVENWRRRRRRRQQLRFFETLRGLCRASERPSTRR